MPENQLFLDENQDDSPLLAATHTLFPGPPFSRVGLTPIQARPSFPRTKGRPPAEFRRLFEAAASCGT